MGHFSLVVYPFIQGENGLSRVLTEKQWFVLGKTLRQIHEIVVPLPRIQQIRRETFPPHWRTSVNTLLSSIESKFSQDEIGQKLHPLLKENKRILQRLVERAEELAEEIQNVSVKFILCHSNIHGGNVLMDETNTIYIIDWDDAILAPKERDLMFIGGGVANVWNEPWEENFFYLGYGERVVQRKILTYYRHEQILEDIALFYPKLLSEKRTSAEKEHLFYLVKAMFKSNGVVDIALRTDESLKKT